MAEEDFDVETLAAYMHLLPAQVARLADRGQIPGRKVSGRWKFSQAEVHHWLERRIGVSDDTELAEMESMLERTASPTGESPITLAELLPLEAVAVPLKARTRGSVISEMAQLVARTGFLWDPEKMAEAVRAREAMHPTALDNGVALLHPRRPMPSILGQPVLALGRTSQGIHFGGGRTPTDIFFLTCAVHDQGHLRTLARLSRLICSAGFLEELRRAPDATSAHRLVLDFDARLG
jgi:PTS system nitrogen regulatory IIA component